MHSVQPSTLLPLRPATGSFRPALLTFTAVAGIVVGAVVLLGGVTVVLGNYAATTCVLAPQLLATWRWCGPVLHIAAGLLALLGGIDCLRVRTAGRKWLRWAAAIAITAWVVDAGLVAISWADVGNNAVLKQAGTVDRVRATMLSSIVLSGVIILTWGILTWVALGRRAIAAAFVPPAVPGRERAERAAVPPEPVPAYAGPRDGSLEYRSRFEPAAAGASLLAPGPLQRLLYSIGLVLGVLTAVTASRLAYDGYQAVRSRPTPVSARIGGLNSDLADERAAVGVETVAGLAAATLVVGSVLGLVQSGGGRVLVFIGVTVLMFCDLGRYALTWPRTLQWALCVPSGTVVTGVTLSIWGQVCSMLMYLLRGQAYAIICYVALARRTPDCAANLIRPASMEFRSAYLPSEVAGE